MRWVFLHGLAFAGAAACQSGSFFVCNDDADCLGNGEPGVCQPSSACSFPDPDCDSGQRYGGSSPPALAGECVSAEAGTGDTEPTGGGEDDDPTSTTGQPGTADDTGAICPPDWWDCAWPHRQRLSLTRTIGRPLVDVPVPVLITHGRVDHERMQSDGEDVRFVSATGTLLPYEIERWDPSAVSTLWTTPDSLGGSHDHLWIYYGNREAENEDDADDTWPEPFVAVMHLEDEPLDSSGNDNHAVSSTSSEVGLGQLANGRQFLGNNSRLELADGPSLDDLFIGGGTLSAWIRPRSWGGSNAGRIAHKSDSVTGWTFNINAGGQLVFSLVHDTAWTTWQSADDTLALHRWAHVAVTFDALGPDAPRLFVDGTELQLQEPPEPPVLDPDTTSDATITLVLGNRLDGARRFIGNIDEFRAERALRSPTWISVQHDATRDDLLEFGPIESWEGAAP